MKAIENKINRIQQLLKEMYDELDSLKNLLSVDNSPTKPKIEDNMGILGQIEEIVRSTRKK